MLTTIEIAKETQATDAWQESLPLLQTCKFDFKSLEDIGKILRFAAQYFAAHPKVLEGVEALMVNAVEHGNLGIGYDKKTELLKAERWEEEIRARLEQPEYKDKRAELVLTRKDGGIYVIVKDQGEGFDWKRYMAIDPARSSASHGRGIAHAHSVSFAKLTYNEEGTQAVGFIPEKDGLDW